MPPSVKEMKAKIASAGLATSDLLERDDVETRYRASAAPTRRRRPAQGY